MDTKKLLLIVVGMLSNASASASHESFFRPETPYLRISTIMSHLWPARPQSPDPGFPSQMQSVLTFSNCRASVQDLAKLKQLEHDNQVAREQAAAQKQHEQQEQLRVAQLCASLTTAHHRRVDILRQDYNPQRPAAFVPPSLLIRGRSGSFEGRTGRSARRESKSPDSRTTSRNDMSPTPSSTSASPHKARTSPTCREQQANVMQRTSSTGSLLNEVVEEERA